MTDNTTPSTELTCPIRGITHGRLEHTDQGFRFIAYRQRFSGLERQTWLSVEAFMADYRVTSRETRGAA